MTFDFYHQYKDYSNTELLKIVQRPEQFQAEAVLAANKILGERAVSDNEIEQVQSYYETIDNVTKNRKDKINSYKEKTFDFLEPILHPSSEVKPEKWLHILLVIIALQYVWKLFLHIIDFIKFIKFVIDCKAFGFNNSASGSISYWTCFTSRFDLFIFFEVLTLIYVPFIFYLLYKKNRWGWILLFADNVFGLIASVGQFYTFYMYPIFHTENSFSIITEILINGLFVFFLWRKSISDLFSVSLATKKKTVIFTIIFTAVLLLSLQIFM